MCHAVLPYVCVREREFYVCVFFFYLIIKTENFGLTNFICQLQKRVLLRVLRQNKEKTSVICLNESCYVRILQLECVLEGG